MTATAPAAPPCSEPKTPPDDGRRFDKVTIRRFRGLEELELDGLGGFNLFVGANDVGKTSVLEAILLLCGPTNSMVLLPLQNRRHFVVSEFDDLAIVFHSLNIDENIELTARSREETRKVCISSAYTWASGQPGLARPDMQGGRLEGGKLTDVSTSFGVDAERTIQWTGEVSPQTGNAPLSFTTQFRFLKDEIKLDADVALPDAKKIGDRMQIRANFVGAVYESETVADIIAKKRKEDLLRSLKGVDPRIRDVTVRAGAVYLDIGMKEMLPMNMFGNGAGRVTSFIAPCILHDIRSIMIDEIENGLHYTTMRQVLGSILHLAVSRGIQVYATAHSIDVLKCLREILLEDEFKAYRSTIACHVLARDWKDRVRSYRYGYEQFDHCIKHEIEIR